MCYCCPYLYDCADFPPYFTCEDIWDWFESHSESYYEDEDYWDWY